MTSSVRHVARALERAGVLGEFWTCQDTRGAHVSHSADPFAVARTLAVDFLEKTAAQIEALCHSLDLNVSARLETERFQGVYAFEDAAAASFRTAGERGLLRCYELPAGHWEAEFQICEEESAREPEWAATLNPRTQDQRAIARKEAELQQADLVVVASSFLMKTLDRNAAPQATIAALSPGTEWHTHPTIRNEPAARGKLRALFVGPLEQRKGLSYLFRACRELRGEVSLTVVSPPTAARCPALDRELGEVLWQPAPTPEALRAAMAAHDVLLAPSLFEGRDTVIPEALASGLPLIATPHTAAPDLISPNVEGFIVPVRSTDEIVHALERLRRDPALLAHMSANAQQRAQRNTWQRYESALAALVVTALGRR